MTILALTPAEFKQAAEDWLTVGGALIVPLTTLAGAVFGFIAFVKSKAAEIGVKNNADRLDRHGQNLKELNLAMPPGAVQAAPAFNMPPRPDAAAIQAAFAPQEITVPAGMAATVERIPAPPQSPQ